MRQWKQAASAPGGQRPPARCGLRARQRAGAAAIDMQMKTQNRAGRTCSRLLPRGRARAPAAGDGGGSGSPDARQLATARAPVAAGDRRSDARHSSRPDGGSRGSGGGSDHEDAGPGKENVDGGPGYMDAGEETEADASRVDCVPRGRSARSHRGTQRGRSIQCPPSGCQGAGDRQSDARHSSSLGRRASVVPAALVVGGRCNGDTGGGSGRGDGCGDEDAESGGEDARAPAAAHGSRTDARHQVPGPTGDGDADGGSKGGGGSNYEDAGPGKENVDGGPGPYMDAGEEMEADASRVDCVPRLPRRRSTRPVASGAKDICMDMDVHAAAVLIAMKSGRRSLELRCRQWCPATTQDTPHCPQPIQQKEIYPAAWYLCMETPPSPR